MRLYAAVWGVACSLVWASAHAEGEATTPPPLVEVLAPSAALADLAYLFAPVLLFSPDEPLRREDLLRPLPTDVDEVRGPVVYYQFATQRRLRMGKSRVRANRGPQVCGDSLIVAPGDRVLIEVVYFCYYPYDVGVGGHEHDIETLRVGLRVACSDSARLQIDVTFIQGSAHGLFVVYNTLDGSDLRPQELRLPLFCLVEEGKHAMCPDRNRDGMYMPGYDVTRRPNDAWGIRDVMASGRVGTSTYHGYMTRPRSREAAVAPRGGPSGEVFVARRDDVHAATEYSLRCAVAVEKTQDADSRLVEICRRNGIGDWDQEAMGEARGSFLHQTGLHYRYDGGYHGYSMIVPGIPWIVYRRGFDDAPLVGGLLGIRTGWTFRGGGRRRLQAGLWYMPSVGRVRDWYAEVGVEGELDEKSSSWCGAVELGNRFLIPFEHRLPLVRAIGICAGVRATVSQGGLSRSRLTVELGFGD